MHWIFLLVSLIFTAMSSAQELNVCVEDADYTPYINLENEGALSYLLNQAAAEVGLSVRYHHRPWRRCLSMVQYGAYDAVMAVSWTADRAKVLAFPLDAHGQPREEDQIWLGDYSVFVHKDSALTWDGELFSGLKTGLGTPRGYVSEQRLKQLNALAPSSIPLDQGLSLVSLTRLDGYIVERQIGVHAARVAKIEARLKILPTPFIQLPWYVAFSPDYYTNNSAKVEQLWRSLGIIRTQSEEALERLYGITLPP